MTNHEYEHLFGWMRRNPTWAKEIAAIDALRAELAEAKDGAFQLFTLANTHLARAQQAEADRDRLRELLREAHGAMYSSFPDEGELDDLGNRIDAALGGANQMC